ncbi:hypothetical protein CLIB1423_02S01310 [[Candida] railenensis]|uniref:NAD(P)-binding domain-containing protein n=1 Tax=[Candida] railenensis TaxID=45579 RepID=A0A9P0QL19_9ASCO|nr:hypothetical protein CLIB1423_02S01310 [[Candida] railenensis]
MYDEHFLVTGGAGFIGSNFLIHFVKKYPNHHFTCIDKLNYASNYSLQNVDEIMSYPNFRFIKEDLATFTPDLQLVDTVVHFAAESCVDRSFGSPSMFIENNILATQNLLESVRKLLNGSEPQRRKKFRFIHISTDEVYGESSMNSSCSGFDEYSPLNPTNPYSSSKASVDLIIKSYQYSYKLPIVILRPNNVFGKNQYPEKIIPLAIDRLMSKQLIPLHGDGSNKRTYIHIDDFVKSIELVWGLFKRDSASISGEIFNIGTENEIDNLSLVKYITSEYLSTTDESLISKQIEFVEDRNYNDSRYKINYGKIKILGWFPEVDFKQGIRDLIRHERAKLEKHSNT